MIISFTILVMSAAVGWLSTRLVLGALKARAILDRPNDRSSHSIPTPRGGGWGILIVLIPAWALIAQQTASQNAGLPLIAGINLLALISWLDDLYNLSAALRFGIQIVAVACGLWSLPPDMLICQGWLPLDLDRAVAGFLWLWFINLTNFMDGIDGIVAGQSVFLGLGSWALAGSNAILGLQGLTMSGAAYGFLCFNWQPARVFLGDVGSVTLGYAGGWLMLMLAGQGAWAAALLLPAYFLADAGITLLRRIIRGEKIWQAHRQHFYQKAVRSGLAHAVVVRRVIIADLCLLAAAWFSDIAPWAALAAGMVIVTILLCVLARGKADKGIIA